MLAGVIAGRMVDTLTEAAEDELFNRITNPDRDTAPSIGSLQQVMSLNPLDYTMFLSATNVVRHSKLAPTTPGTAKTLPNHIYGCDFSSKFLTWRISFMVFVKNVLWSMRKRVDLICRESIFARVYLCENGFVGLKTRFHPVDGKLSDLLDLISSATLFFRG